MGLTGIGPKKQDQAARATGLPSHQGLGQKLSDLISVAMRVSTAQTSIGAGTVEIGTSSQLFSSVHKMTLSI